MGDHLPGCPQNWEPPGTACWCDLPEDYELAADGEEDDDVATRVSVELTP